MYSRMNDVAKLLGVRIGENFEINDKTGKFVFDNKGLYSMSIQSYCYKELNALLSGDLKIKPQPVKPWKPADNKTFYIVNECGDVVQDLWWGDCADIMYYKLGNCYPTEADARKHRDKWIAFYASDKILEV